MVPFTVAPVNAKTLLSQSSSTTELLLRPVLTVMLCSLVPATPRLATSVILAETFALDMSTKCLPFTGVPETVSVAE